MALNDKDLELKLFVSTVFRHLGYTVFHEVDLCTYSYQPKYTRKQITDFDVLGVNIEADFATHIAVAECKSLEEKAMENLLKLNGVKDFFHADKAYFVQKQIDVNAREIGRDLGIWILDEKNLLSLMASMGISETSHVANEKKVYEVKVQSSINKKSDLSKLLEYLKYDYWTLPDHRNIINIIRLLQNTASKFDAKNIGHIALAHQLATNLALSVIRLASEVIKHNINEVSEGSLTRILGGARERRDREALFDTIAKVVPDNRLTPVPLFFDNFVELVARLLNASSFSSKIVPCMDHLTRSVLVPDVNIIYGTPEEAYGSRTLKLSRDVLHFIIKQTGVSESIYSHSLLEKQEKAQPLNSADPKSRAAD